jgi:hypothetical protein
MNEQLKWEPIEILTYESQNRTLAIQITSSNIGDSRPPIYSYTLGVVQDNKFKSHMHIRDRDVVAFIILLQKAHDRIKEATDKAIQMTSDILKGNRANQEPTKPVVPVVLETPVGIVAVEGVVGQPVIEEKPVEAPRTKKKVSKDTTSTPITASIGEMLKAKE